jgi:hypothetical protein
MKNLTYCRAHQGQKLKKIARGERMVIIFYIYNFQMKVTTCHTEGSQ